MLSGKGITDPKLLPHQALRQSPEVIAFGGPRGIGNGGRFLLESCLLCKADQLQKLQLVEYPPSAESYATVYILVRWSLSLFCR